MNAFVDTEDVSNNTVVEAMRYTFELIPEVWNNVEHRQLAIGALLRVGTNMILHNDIEDERIYPVHIHGNIGLARDVGFAILLLECYDGRSDDSYAVKSAIVKGGAFANASGCNARDLLKFYCKRISCSCLREKYRHARKTLPKLGKCTHCKQRMERSSLMTCGRCKVPLYCSRKCQVANWPVRHEERCGVFVDIRKCQEAQATQMMNK